MEVSPVNSKTSNYIEAKPFYPQYIYHPIEKILDPKYVYDRLYKNNNYVQSVGKVKRIRDELRLNRIEESPSSTLEGIKINVGGSTTPWHNEVIKVFGTINCAKRETGTKSYLDMHINCVHYQVMTAVEALAYAEIMKRINGKFDLS